METIHAHSQEKYVPVSLQLGTPVTAQRELLSAVNICQCNNMIGSYIS